MNLLPFLFSGPLCSPAGEDLLCKEPYLLRNNPDSVPPLLRIYQWFPQSSGSDLNSTPTMGNIWSFLYSSFISKKKKKKKNKKKKPTQLQPCFHETWFVHLFIQQLFFEYLLCANPCSRSKSSHVQMWKLDHKEGWAPKNWCFRIWCWRRCPRVPWTARRSNQSILKEINPDIHWKDWCWSWSSNTLATWWEEPSHWKRPWCWERWKAGGEGDNREWNDWMASLTQ